jgi:hypothetical protein
MPRYVSQHSLACLTRQGAEELAARLLNAGAVHIRRVLVSMYDGIMLAEFDAESREVLEQWLGSEHFYFDWIRRIDFESIDGRLTGTS